MTTAFSDKPCTRPAAAAFRRSSAKKPRLFERIAKDWELLDDAHRIQRKFDFANFREALNFVEGVGKIAEAEGHHPEICFGWGYAKVSLQTKKIKGLHENDFIMAVKIDRLFDSTRASVADRNK